VKGDKSAAEQANEWRKQQLGKKLKGQKRCGQL
jgi:hypothetical protein